MNATLIFTSIFILLTIVSVILILILCIEKTSISASMQSMSESPKVLLVGNAPFDEEQENGEYIDSFDIVVRFNGYVVEGYEKYVGTKVTHWFSNHWHILKNKDYLPEKKMTIKNKYIIESPDPDFKMEHIKNFQSIPCYYKNKFFPQNIYNKYFKDKVSCDIDNKCFPDYPSTGLVTIFYFLEKYEKIYITGFNFLELGKKLHYYSNKLSKFDEEPDTEEAIITQLINEGRVIKF